MVTLFFRTIIIYLFLIFSVRIMGKRQLGELELSELVTTLMVSELAVTPISDKHIPILYGIVPILILLSLEVIISGVITSSAIAKRIFCPTPAILVKDGKIDESELRRSRIGLDELMSSLRQNGTSHLGEVKYAIMESNGKLSVIMNKESSAPGAKDMKIKVTEDGIDHNIIIDSRISGRGLYQANKDEAWLYRELDRLGKTKEEILLMTVDDNGKIQVHERQKARGKSKKS